VRLPGSRRSALRHRAETEGLAIDDALHAAIEAL
jgi:LDH2 family malate/lactate/ureidoglycolate dehydrogenase